MKRFANFLLLSLTLSLIGCSHQNPVETINLSRNWKFSKGDSMLYASPRFDDSGWKEINPTEIWEKQGYPDYDGYAWYRIHFVLPLSLKKTSYYRDSLQIFLDLIDDADQTYMNGFILGENGTLINSGNVNALKIISDAPDAYRISRRYVISANDSRLQWNKENVLAVRVFDHGGGGGMYGKDQSIRMLDVMDYLKMDISQSSLRLTGANSFSKSITLVNLSLKDIYEGKLTIDVRDAETKNKVYFSEENLVIHPSNSAKKEFEFNADQTKRMVIYFQFNEKNSGKIIRSQLELSYILTPKSSDSPRINGTKVYGQRPDKPFLYLIATTGVRPITFSASHLPEGLSLNATTGIISGVARQAGEYIVKVKAQNEKGITERDLKIVIGNNLALTPPLGWNSWNCWGLSVDAAKVKNAADKLISSGLANHGWTYINIDDGWEASKRAQNGEILTNEKFPEMKSVTDYVHSKGLKMGIYSSPGPRTCGGYLGSYQHEEQDVNSWANWGIDYIKYDWCSYDQIAKNKGLEELKKPYLKLRKALDKASRDIVYSMCQYGMGDVWKWGDEVGGNLWRTTGDISDNWESMHGIGFTQVQNAAYSKPGNWNDPDMLVVGWVGWGPSLHPSQLSASEQYTHISLWALLSSPMLIGCDLERLDDFTLNLLTNDEVLEIDQDPLGRQARPLEKTESYEIWAKDLEDGSKAVGLFNVSQEEKIISLHFGMLALNGKHNLRDVWRQKDLGEFADTYETKIDSHGVLLLRVK